MPSFQTPFQRFIADGRLALWMLGSLPLLVRGLLSIAPFDPISLLESRPPLDAAMLGWLVLVASVLRIYQYVASSLFEATTEHGQRYLQNKWRFEIWLGGFGVVLYLLLTSTLLPLWFGFLLDLAVLALVVRHGRTRAKALVEELALFARLRR